MSAPHHPDASPARRAAGPTGRTRIVVAVAAVVALAALTGCSRGGSDDSSAAGAADIAHEGSSSSLASPESPGGGSAGKDASTDGQAGRQGGTGGSGVSPAALRATQQQLARRATVAVEVKNIGQAVAKVRSAAAAASGIVLSENIGTADPDAPVARGAEVDANTYGELTISVPSDKLDSVVAELGSIGKVLRSSTSSEDVGGQIVDTQSRLATMRASVERVRAFLREAKDLSQVVSLESELTRRQADLEALEAQLASLKDSVAMSPVQVSLTTKAAVIKPLGDDAGFLAGLRGGWTAFTASVTVALTVLGALLPFVVLAALVGLPLLAWWRRHRRGEATTAPAAP